MRGPRASNGWLLLLTKKVIYRMTKNISLLLLAIASLGLSRVTFTFINDPEGPNLLIVGVLAVIIFSVLLGAYTLVHRFLLTSKVK